MSLLWHWLGARIEWAWCALWRHPLTRPHRATQNNRFGKIAAVETWRSCQCQQRVGRITRQRYMRPYR